MTLIKKDEKDFFKQKRKRKKLVVAGMHEEDESWTLREGLQSSERNRWSGRQSHKHTRKLRVLIFPKRKSSLRFRVDSVTYLMDWTVSSIFFPIFHKFLPQMQGMGKNLDLESGSASDLGLAWLDETLHRRETVLNIRLRKSVI